MEEQIYLCSNCNNETVQEILKIVDSKGTWYNSIKPDETTELQKQYLLTKCKTCQCVSLYNVVEGDCENVLDWNLCFPHIQNLNADIPVEISNLYREALRVENVSHTAFAILTRKTIELLCKDKGATGKDLYSKLKFLVDRGILPQTIYEMADSIRIIGNIGAHDSSIRLNLFEIQTIKDFILAMIEYVYVAPSKIKKLKESIERKGKHNG
ncbi:MAG: hypothetical protein CVU05_09040 [Bacteroidetes bacterium HGW-Bacteroidetes-21]|jgi:hypothetical protein|nr:MAG: hypothetical protein CVU05_09040 [Bacteroidetes bacterium HGW-Bacteroidetes-21]